MRFAAVFDEYTRTPAFVRASHVARSSWLQVYVYAARIEKGGRLPASAEYTDREWLTHAGVTRDEIRASVEAGLLRWDGDDLVIEGYDHEGEATVQAMRNRGRTNGKASAGKKRKRRRSNIATDVAFNIEATGKRLPGPLSGSDPSASPLPNGGGGGSAASSSGEENGEAHLEAFREARTRAAEGNPEIALVERAVDVAAFRAAVAGLDARLVGRAATLYFERAGRNGTDQWWRSNRWSLFWFTTQGLEELLPEVARPSRRRSTHPDGEIPGLPGGPPPADLRAALERRTG